jgi:hypothetical protein
MTTYDPESRSSRESLAIQLLAKLHECGFSLEKRPHTNEAIYSREVDGTDGKIRVVVYTTVVNGRVPVARPTGKDAIRVCALYSSRDGKERGIARERRVNRTGEISNIIDRTYTRMRAVYAAARTGVCCDRCGAPTFTSKSGNVVCADFCWKSDAELAADNVRYTERRQTENNRVPGRYHRRWRRTA